MKEQYGRLIMVTDTIPTLRTLSRLYSLEFTLVLKRQNVITPPPHPHPEICGLLIHEKIKSRTNSRQKKVWLIAEICLFLSLSLSLSLSLCPLSLYPIYLVLIPFSLCNNFFTVNPVFF